MKRQVFQIALIASVLTGSVIAQSQPSTPTTRLARTPAVATPTTAPIDTQTIGETHPDTIQLTFPDDVALKTVLDYIAARLCINIIYDDTVAKQKITIRSPQPVTQDQLVPLLRSALKFRGLALVDAEQAGWLTVVSADKLIQESHWSSGPILESMDSNRVVAHVIRLDHTTSGVFKEILQTYLSKPGGNVILLPDGRTMIVTDYAAVVDKVLRLKKLIDVPGAARDWRVFELQKASPAQVATVLPDLITKTGIAPVGKSDTKDGRQGVSVLALAQTHSLLVIGSLDQLDRINPLVQLLDVRVDQATRIYPLKYATASRAASLLQQIAKPQLSNGAATQAWTITADVESNSLIVTAPTNDHTRIAKWITDLVDRPASMTSSGLATRVFVVKFARAAELIQTLRSVFAGGVSTEDIPLQTGELGTLGQPKVGSPSMQGITKSTSQQMSGATAGSVSGASTGTAVVSVQGSITGNVSEGVSRISTKTVSGTRSGTASGVSTKNSGGRSTGQQSLFQGDRKQTDIHMTVDVPTNSIICTAPAPVLEQVSQLIARLDHHRPQVLINVTIVSLSQSSALDMGIEIQYLKSKDGKLSQGLLSSFGLFDVDASAGTATATIGSGLNAVLMRSDDVSVILRALQTKLNARVLARPRLLVADNETGTLHSVNEQPFTSVNTSNTISTTSFGGYAEAGTQVTLTPHISESDVVHLEYNIVSSSFTGSSTDSSSPPPRATDSVSSKVTIPSGYTLLVGGLVRHDWHKTRRQIPVLSDLPFVGELFKSQSNSDTESMLFVFISPVIHREDRFVYLRHVSDEARIEANLDPTEPPLEMEWIR